MYEFIINDNKRCCNFFSPDSYTSTLHSGRLSNDYHSFSRRVYSASSPLIFTGGGGQKVWNLASSFDTTLLWVAVISKWSNRLLPKYPVWCSDDGALFSPNLMQFGPPPLWAAEFGSTPHWKIGYIVNNSAGDCSISLSFVQSLTMWHPIYCKCSRSGVRGQGNVTGGGIKKSLSYQ